MIDTEHLENISAGDTVAFRSIRSDVSGWFTGIVRGVFPSSLMIEVNIPVEPQWYKDDAFTLALEGDIDRIILLEKK